MLTLPLPMFYPCFSGFIIYFLFTIISTPFILTLVTWCFSDDIPKSGYKLVVLSLSLGPNLDGTIWDDVCLSFGLSTHLITLWKMTPHTLLGLLPLITASPICLPSLISLMMFSVHLSCWKLTVTADYSSVTITSFPASALLFYWESIALSLPFLSSDITSFMPPRSMSFLPFTNSCSLEFPENSHSCSR